MVTTFVTKLRQFTLQFRYVLISLVLLNIRPLFGLAQDRHSHTPVALEEPAPEQRNKAHALIKIVRESTERFKNVYVAEEESYVLQFGCASGSGSGLHYANQTLVNRGEIKTVHPQIVIYRPSPNRGLRLIGADFLVIAEAWDTQSQNPPEPMEQLVRYFGFPNRFGLPAFYKLQVWAWEDNSNGALVNLHSNVSCELFGGQTR